jgi:glycosyltransferase involved in cell wall biosynthesis
LKIGFLTYGYGRRALGTGTYGWYLTHELRSLGIEVDVFTTNLHIKKIGPLLHSFRHLFKRFQYYDVIHSNEGAGFFISHSTMVETYHHDYGQVHELEYHFFNALENLECRKVDHIIVPSYASRNSLIHNGFLPEKISVIHHGVDHKSFRVDKLTRDKMRSKFSLSKYFVVINVARFVKHKRQIDIIKALEKIPNAILILVGKGEGEKTLYETASEKGVRLLHFKDISDELLAGLYNAADVYVHTSALEGFGLTILEAMACGLPIIAYRTADLNQIVGNAGYLLDIGDVYGVNSALSFLIEDSEKRNEMATLAALNSKNYSWSEAAKKHAQVYRRVLAD